jgi:hypothetical protein
VKPQLYNGLSGGPDFNYETHDECSTHNHLFPIFLL